MNKKLSVLTFCLIMLVVAVAATWSNTWIDGLFTGNGTTTTDIALPTWGVNQNAVVQISRNQTGDGGGQCSALDLYSGAGAPGTGGCPWPPGTSVGGYLQRWWIDCPVDGGKCVSMSFDYGGNLLLLGSITASGIVTDHNSTGVALRPIGPYSDGYSVAAWSDMPYGAGLVSAAHPPAVEGAADSQVFIAMDGHEQDAGIGEYKPNVRLAIDGNSGTIRWSHSIANSYRTATWDVAFGRVAAKIFGDPGGISSIQTPHLDQPTSDNDVGGTLAVVAAANKTNTFATAYTSAPICVLTPTANMGGIIWWVTTTTTTVRVDLSAVATKTFTYVCVGNPN